MHFDASEYPIISSAEIMRTKGNPEDTATFAAIAVFPQDGGPRSITLIIGVLSEDRTESKKAKSVRK